MRKIVISLVAGCLVVLGAVGPVQAAPPSHKVKQNKDTPIGKIVKRSVPLPIPRGEDAAKTRERPGGPPVEFKGAAPKAAAASKGANAAAPQPAATSGAYWPGAYYLNPARQTGKLLFWTGTRWSHCSAAAINSASKSLVLTAGHCVFDTISNRWSTNVAFCPGYRVGCRLGAWYATRLGTTSSWVNSTSTNYHWEDDVGVVKVARNPNRGYLVNYAGGQGIAFNQATNLYRSAFGYPAPDYRFPQFNWNDEYLAYCQNYSSYDGYGHVRIPCTMTGGASGGPWLSFVQSNWLGYANGVNSHKPNAYYMSSPYFGNTELSLWNYWKAQ
jgi:V8-like Glu-specific endopeptidase